MFLPTDRKKGILCKINSYLLIKKKSNIFTITTLKKKTVVYLPRGSWGVPLKIMRYVVRKRAPSAGRMCGPPRRPPVASSLPSGSRSTRNPSDTNSSPGSSAGRRILGWQEKKRITRYTQGQTHKLYLSMNTASKTKKTEQNKKKPFTSVRQI